MVRVQFWPRRNRHLAMTNLRHCERSEAISMESQFAAYIADSSVSFRVSSRAGSPL